MSTYYSGVLTNPGTYYPGVLTNPGTYYPGVLTNPGTYYPGVLTNPGTYYPGVLTNPGTYFPGVLTNPRWLDKRGSRYHKCVSEKTSCECSPNFKQCMVPGRGKLKNEECLPHRSMMTSHDITVP